MHTIFLIIIRKRWSLMSQWIENLQLILNQGYLLTTKIQESNLNYVISILKNEITPFTVDVDNEIFRMVRVRQLLRDIPEDPVFSYIYNKLSRLYNNRLRELANTHYEAIKYYNYFHAEADNKLIALPPDTNPINPINAVTHRISLVNNYRQLEERFLSETSTTKYDKSFEEISRVIESHPDHFFAINGLSLIEKSSPLSSNINLKKALQLAWSLIPNDADKAKKMLCENLAIFGKKFFDAEQIINTDKKAAWVLSEKDFFQIKATEDYEHALRLILQPLHPTHVVILNSTDEITSVIKKICDDRLKGYVANEPVSEQAKLLYHLDPKKKETPADHLVFKTYIEETTLSLEKEFSAFRFIIENVSDIIKKQVELCIAEISFDWLRSHTKERLKNELQSTFDKESSTAAQKKESLLKTLTVEIQSLEPFYTPRSPSKAPNIDTKLPESIHANERLLLLKLLHRRTTELIPSQRGVTYRAEADEINALHERYKELLLLDEYHGALNTIIKLQNNPENKFLYLPLKNKASKLLKDFSYASFIKSENIYRITQNPYLKFHVEKTLVKPGQPWLEYHKSMPLRVARLKAEVESLKSIKKELDSNLAEAKKKTVPLFNNFKYPSSYDALHKNDLGSTVAAIFKDYADKAHWYYFHAFRNHIKEAREIETTVKGFKNIHEITTYLIAIKDDLIAHNKLNLTGSFSRRIHYCLNVLIPIEQRRVPAINRPALAN
jgi:hypothetical protein